MAGAARLAAASFWPTTHLVLFNQTGSKEQQTQAIRLAPPAQAVRTGTCAECGRGPRSTKGQPALLRRDEQEIVTI
jgi:hypothetical protein